jgi:hypothetical protein
MPRVPRSNTDQQKIQVAVITACITILMHNVVSIESISWLGGQFASDFYNPRYLLGKGAPGMSRWRYTQLVSIDVFGAILARGSEGQMHCLTRMTISQFQALLDDLANIEFASVGTRMSFANKVLCTFIWIVKYPDYSELSALFGVSISVINTVLQRFVECYLVSF